MGPRSPPTPGHLSPFPLMGVIAVDGGRERVVSTLLGEQTELLYVYAKKHSPFKCPGGKGRGAVEVSGQ